MTTILSLLNLLALLGLAPTLMQARRGLRDTTLGMAWSWAAGAWALWTAIMLAAACRILPPGGVSDQLWYGAAVLMLCPPIAVLGAKQPMARVWSVFILVPLMLVFGWPAASAWGRHWQDSAWVVEEPVLAGYVFVLAMGIGNYAGTRYCLSAFLWSAAALLVVVPLCPAIPWTVGPEFSQTAATLCLAAAGWWGFWRTRTRTIAATPIDRLWQDFRNDFGIVWARRIQERFNETARKEDWAVRLTPRGLQPATATSAQPADLSSQTQAAMQARLRWLLRRFVEPAWIDRRQSAP